jgi:hypothetical protein
MQRVMRDDEREKTKSCIPRASPDRLHIVVFISSIKCSKRVEKKRDEISDRKNDKFFACTRLFQIL